MHPEEDALRPLVHPALTQVWRDPTTIQIGLDPARALVLGGVNAEEASVLRAIDGSRDDATLRAVATDTGGDAAAADRILEILRSAGVVVDGERVATDSHDGAADDPLAPDRASLGLLTGAADGGAANLEARRNQWVEVRGAGRVGAAAARLLSAAGVGCVTARDPETATAHDVTPAGLGSRDIGQPRERAAHRVLDSDRQPLAEPADPSLVILAPADGCITTGWDALLGTGIPHIAARVVEVTGIVGPLIVPGRSSCLRCHDLHRTDRDPAWPRIVAQAGLRRPGIAACDVTLAAEVAAIAAQQALAYLDGYTPAAVDGTVEVSLPYGLPRRRSWRPHPSCGCTWS